MSDIAVVAQRRCSRTPNGIRNLQMETIATIAKSQRSTDQLYSLDHDFDEPSITGSQGLEWVLLHESISWPGNDFLRPDLSVEEMMT